MAKQKNQKKTKTNTNTSEDVAVNEPGRPSGVKARPLPDAIRSRPTALHGFVAGSVLSIEGELVSIASREGKASKCSLKSPATHLASGDRWAAIACREDDGSQSVYTMGPTGDLHRIAAGIPAIQDVAIVDDSVVASTAVSPTAVPRLLILDASGKSRPRPLRIEADHDVTLSVMPDGSVVARDKVCRRWWWIDPLECIIKDQGDGGTTVPHEGGKVDADPNGTVTHVSDDPCQTRLPHPISTLWAIPTALVAMSNRNRELSMLHPDTLERHFEYQFGRQGAELHYDADERIIHALDLDRGLWIEFLLDMLFPASVEEPTEDGAVSIGRTTQPLIADRATAVGAQKILALPITEPGNSIGDRDLLRDYIHTAVVDELAAYYNDASKTQLQLSADVYGFEGVAVGDGPLPISAPFEDFWNGALEPGGFRIRIPDAASPPLVSFDGTEQLTVELTDASRGFTNQAFTIVPSAARLLFPDVLDSSGAGTLEILPGSVIAIIDDVDGVAGSLSTPLTARAYAMPAQIGAFESDVNAALDAGWMAAGSLADRKIRARCRVHPRNSDVMVDLHYDNDVSGERRVTRIIVAPEDPALATIRLGRFEFSQYHGIPERFELEEYLTAAFESAVIDGGFTVSSRPAIDFRVSGSAPNFDVRVEADRFDGELRLTGQSGFEQLGFNPPSSTTTRGFTGDIILAEEAEPLRLDGSERAAGVTDRGVAFQLRAPALRGEAAIPVTGDLDFTNVAGEMSINGTVYPLTFPPETVPAATADLTSYLNRVLSAAGVAAPDRLEAEVSVTPDGLFRSALFFAVEPPAGNGPRSVSLSITADPELSAFSIGLSSLDPTNEIIVGGSLNGFEDDLVWALNTAPFVRPVATSEGNDVVARFDFDLSQAGSGNFATISSNSDGLDRYGFDRATPVVGNDVAIGSEWASHSFRDDAGRPGLGSEVLTALHDRHGTDTRSVLDQIARYHSIMLVLVGEPPAGGGWTSNPTSLTRQRVFASGANVASRRDNRLSLDTNWFLVALDGENELFTTVHEFGHAIGLYDLYPIAGVHRDDLRYMEDLCVMDNSDRLNTICGYHKLGTAWADDPLVVAPASAGTEAIVYPVEYDVAPADRTALRAAVAAAFGSPVDDVFTLVKLSLGGGAAPFGLIEARQRPPATYGTRLPPRGGVMVSHCLDHSDDTRIRDTVGYRRQAHPIAVPASLNAEGDEMALGGLDTLPIGGTKVTVAAIQEVMFAGQTFNAFKLQIDREEAEVLDLYFDDADPQWKAPDVWVDDPDNGREAYGPGEPRHQGDVVRHPLFDGTIQHKIVARVHNGSDFEVPEAKVAFYLCSPPGSGDSGNFIRLDEGVARNIPPRGSALAEVDWNVQMGDRGHQCVRAEIFDWTLPPVAPGDPGFTGDITEGNNRAQKNVDQFDDVVSASPFAPVVFQYSVANDGPDPERVRLQPAGLQPGMTLTVRPASQVVEPGAVAMFSCTLELDHQTVEMGCKHDREYSLTAWRQTGDSWERWGGCSYLVRPRRKTTTVIDGSLAYGQFSVDGRVEPTPGSGTVELQIRPDDGELFTRTVLVSALGGFSLAMRDVDWDVVEVAAVYSGDQVWGKSTSNSLRLPHARLI